MAECSRFSRRPVLVAARLPALESGTVSPGRTPDTPLCVTRPRPEDSVPISSPGPRAASEACCCCLSCVVAPGFWGSLASASGDSGATCFRRHPPSKVWSPHGPLMEGCSSRRDQPKAPWVDPRAPGVAGDECLPVASVLPGCGGATGDAAAPPGVDVSVIAVPGPAKQTCIQ